jgi:hypothetical protein
MAKCSPIDPALLEDGVAAFDTYMRNTLARTECCMQGMVLSFDRISHTALIQPLCDFVTNIGDSVQRKPITMHVWRFACGGKIIDFQMRKGDTGWIIASDYDSFLQKINNSNIDESKNEGSSNPNTAESHSYRHGFFMPDNFCSFPDIVRFGDDLVLGEYDKEGNITAWQGGGGGGMFRYDRSSKKIGSGIVMVRRQAIFVSETDISSENQDSYVFLHVIHGKSNVIMATIQCAESINIYQSGQVVGQANSGYTDIPLYKLSGWNVEADYRYATIVPIYE